MAKSATRALCHSMKYRILQTKKIIISQEIYFEKLSIALNTEMDKLIILIFGQKTMEKEYLNIIISELEGLAEDLYSAKKTRDKRSLNKRVREAKTAIVAYVCSLPSEVQGFLNVKVDINAMNYKWVDSDFEECIKALKGCADSISEMQTSEN